jgi:hypothetical protein
MKALRRQSSCRSSCKLRLTSPGPIEQRARWPKVVGASCATRRSASYVAWVWRLVSSRGSFVGRFASFKQRRRRARQLTRGADELEVMMQYQGGQSRSRGRSSAVVGRWVGCYRPSQPVIRGGWAWRRDESQEEAAVRCTEAMPAWAPTRDMDGTITSTWTGLDTGIANGQTPRADIALFYYLPPYLRSRSAVLPCGIRKLLARSPQMETALVSFRGPAPMAPYVKLLSGRGAITARLYLAPWTSG